MIRDPASGARVLSEDAAHRVLARAIELDAAERGGMSMERVLDIAREVGVSPEAIESALRDDREAAAMLSAPRPGRMQRAWGYVQRFLIPDMGTQRRWEWLGRNLFAYAAVSVVYIFAAKQGWGIFGHEWRVVSQSLGTLAGLAVALGFRARIVAVGLAGLLVADAVGYTVAGSFQWPIVGASLGRLSTILAGILGVSIGLFFGRRGGRWQSRDADATATESQAATQPDAPQHPSRIAFLAVTA